jgi:hypothetical protein
VETFAEEREFVDYRGFATSRERVVSSLAPASLDRPIVDVVLGFAKLPHCFTLQSCFGHFVYDGQPDIGSLRALPEHDVGDVTWRIAYLALCIEQSEAGARLRDALAGLTATDPEYVQFGSPGWFWEQHPNSYALQVEPGRFRLKDQAVIPYNEALHVQGVRDEFFARLRRVLGEELHEAGAG